MIRYQYLLVCVIVVLNTITSIHASEPEYVLTVGVYNNSPKVTQTQNHIPQGIFIDVLEYIDEHTYLTFKYVEGNWSELYTKLQNNEIDILPDMAYSDYRDSLFVFSKIPVLESWLEIFSLHNQRFYSVADLHTKRIGVLRQSVQESYFSKEVSALFGISYELKVYNSYPELVNNLKHNNVDAIVMSRFFHFSDLCDTSIYSNAIILRPSQLFFAFSTGISPSVVSLFDAELSHMLNDGDSAYYDSLHEWLNNDNESVISHYIIWLVLFILALLCVTIIFIFFLRKQVAKKTREVIKAKERAEESDRLKTAFLSNMSHEIRTPMNGILNFIELLQETDLSGEETQSYIQIIDQSGQRLLHTINDIIEMSKIESQDISIHPSSFSVIEMICYVFDYYNFQLSKKGISFELDIALTEYEAGIVSDKTKIQEILNKLVENALKFTHKGKIVVGCYIEQGHIVLYVRDSGIGIAEHKQSIIFDRFVQVYDDQTHLYEGSGLGLSIVRSYVNMLDGTVWLESELHKGSAFFVSLPYVKSRKNGRKLMRTNLETAIPSNKTILIVDNNEKGCLYLSNIFKKERISYMCVGNGTDAVEIIQKNPHIALVIIDMNSFDEFPEGDTVLEIRTWNPILPIIIQTTHLFSEKIERLAEDDYLEYIAKPVSRKELITKMTRLLI
ncbi:MAG: ATP-binding protein [Bacteroidales bacterium]|jgi:signal transduction histidine kinase|nr:ATP-binding protein [Bacteroidales bacterium]